MLRSLTGDTFPRVVHFYTRELTQPLTGQSGEQIFAKGASAFIGTAAKIVQEEKQSRLVELLRRYFGEKLAAAIVPTEQSSSGAGAV